ncbi:MAG: citramalate synthase [Candidatus Nezhaarchaeota archaeon]|nr:citramalate synthase [Candidatus Nezhaarchaeota archaeon]
MTKFRQLPSQVEVYDTTLRDGAQGRGVSFSLQDKLSLTLKLDEFGVHFIEGGWPASNPKDREYFELIGDYSLSNAKVVAFTSTRRKDLKASEDPSVNEVLKCDVEVAAIVGSSSRFHVERVLRTSLETNLEMVRDTIEYLVEHGVKVVFDAEHFFDSYKSSSDYALKVVREAEGAGAYRIVLCDTNGGNLPHEVGSIVTEVRRLLKTPIGIHCHNDAGVAVANTIEAVLAGATHVQGTINGLGERCGNADLCQVIPALELKLGIKALAIDKPREERLRKLTEISAYVYDLANLPPNPYQPYVGKYAFAHKAGIHIDAVLKACEAYEHIKPEVVGNQRLLTTSEIVGRAGVVSKAKELGFPVSEDDPAIINILNEVKELEYQGYQLEDADATLFLIILRHLGIYEELFKLISWKAVSGAGNGGSLAEGVVKVMIGGETCYEISEGLGPVHAQDLALRKALSRAYPEALSVHLINYKVSVIDRGMGTASKVRVFMEFSDGQRNWTTVGVSTNILEASEKALVDGYDYYLQRRRSPWLK